MFSKIAAFITVNFNKLIKICQKQVHFNKGYLDVSPTHTAKPYTTPTYPW